MKMAIENGKTYIYILRYKKGVYAGTRDSIGYIAQLLLFEEQRNEKKKTLTPNLFTTPRLLMPKFGIPYAQA